MFTGSDWSVGGAPGETAGGAVQTAVLHGISSDFGITKSKGTLLVKTVQKMWKRQTAKNGSNIYHGVCLYMIFVYKKPMVSWGALPLFTRVKTHFELTATMIDHSGRSFQN